MANATPLATEDLVTRLAPPTQRRVRAVLDTDTYNEVDDQFALAYAVLAKDAIDLQAVYAAPFHNARSNGPGDGMERSYEEILRVLQRLDTPADGIVFKGSDAYLPGADVPVDSPAARDLIAKTGDMPDPHPLYVLTIGAPTNVASALLIEPAIARHIVVVWLGGQPHHWHTAREFNLKQDLHASRILFDSGVPLVQIPCTNVAEHLRTTIPELQAWMKGKSAMGDYLFDIVAAYHDNHFAWSKVIWDISTVAWLVNPQWVPSVLTQSPILTDQVTYSRDPRRHLMRVACHCNRDAVFADIFNRFQNG